MFAVPLKEFVLFPMTIFLAVANLVAVSALPLKDPLNVGAFIVSVAATFPVTFIVQEVFLHGSE